MKLKTTKLSILLFLGVITFSVTGCQKTSDTVYYSNVKIQQVKLVNMPFVNNSNVSWDNLNGPDVFFEIENSSGTVVVSGSTINNISQSSLPLTWTLSSALEINNLMSQYTIKLYDYDTPDPDDLIASFYWNFNSYAVQSYPTTISIYGGPTNLHVDLGVVWY